MNTNKISVNDAERIDLKTKIIHKYELPTKLFSLSKMIVKGRHPQDPKKVILEKDCSYAMYVTKGNGKYLVNDKDIEVEEGDVVYVPSGSTFACEGDFEYVTFVIPAYYPEQSEEIEKVK